MEKNIENEKYKNILEKNILEKNIKKNRCECNLFKIFNLFK